MMKRRKNLKSFLLISKYFSKWRRWNSCGHGNKYTSHNLGEVIGTTIAFINNKEITISQLMKHVPGPDFPTGE